MIYNFLKKHKLWLINIPLIVYWIILLTATSIPDTSSIDKLEVSDKIKHLFAYFILTFMLTLWIHFKENTSPVLIKQVLYAIVIAALYGILDEIHQKFIPGRSGDFLDWIADLLGSVLGAFVCYYLLLRRKELILSS